MKWVLRYERALKSDFLLTSLFSPMPYGGRNTQKFQIFEEKIPKFFGVLNWYEMGFAL